MRLCFSEHLSSKTRRGVDIRVFPSGRPADYLVSFEEQERGESVTSTSEYDFPEHSFIVARTEFGGAVIDPDEPTDVGIEVHVAPQARASTLALAENEASMLADKAGLARGDGSGFSVVRHE